MGGAGGNIYVASGDVGTWSNPLTLGTMVLNIDGGGEVVGAVTGPITCYADTGAARTITGDVVSAAADWTVDTFDLTIDGDATFTGAWAGNADNFLIVTGDLSYVDATSEANVHVKMTGAGTTINGQEILARPASVTYAAGASGDSQGNTLYTDKFVLEAGAALTGTNTIYIYLPTANDVLSIDGTLTMDILVHLSASITNAGDVITPNDFVLKASNDSFTQDGAFSVGSTTVYSTIDNFYAELICSDAVVSTGDLVLGDASSALRTGRFTLTGTGNFTTGNLDRGAAATTGNQLNIGPRNGTIEASKTWNGTGITCTADGGNIITGDETCEIKNCEFDHEVKVYGGVQDGEGNVNVTFVEDTIPGVGVRTAVAVE